jgi:hypothetical protein
MMSGPSHSPADPPRQAQTGSRRKQGCWQGYEDRFLDPIITRGLQSDGRRIDPEVGIVPDRDLDDAWTSADLIIRQGGRIEHGAEGYRQKWRQLARNEFKKHLSKLPNTLPGILAIAAALN